MWHDLLTVLLGPIEGLRSSSRDSLVGNEPVVVIDISGMGEYAKSKA